LRRLIILVTTAILVSFSFGERGEDVYREARLDAIRDARSSVNSELWFAVGCLVPTVGLVSASVFYSFSSECPFNWTISGVCGDLFNCLQ